MPALNDNNATLALNEETGLVITKPHGHGDIHNLLFDSGVAKKWADEYYGMRGAFYPHSSYPVDMTMNPYPVPDWGWEVFETPWAVQGVWWHYLYTGDKAFLRDRAFPLIRDAVLFLVDYMTRPDAHGDCGARQRLPSRCM